MLLTVYVPSDFLCGMETVALPSGPTVTGWPTTPLGPVTSTVTVAGTFAEPVPEPLVSIWRS